MPKFVPISRERHGTKRWRRFTSYSFAARSALAQLVAAELPRAAVSLPLAFIEQGDAYAPVAVLGLEPGMNLFVQDDGRWAGSYVPSAFRSHPFSLAQADGDQLVLCVDEESGLLTDGAEGEGLFSEQGEPSDALAQVLGFLQEIERNKAPTRAACAELASHDLLQPWPIKIKTTAGDRQVEGLFKVDEGGLGKLPDDAFLRLRKSGALPMAYCQLLSMHHLGALQQLAAVKAKAALVPKKPAADQFVLQDDDLLHF
ncbi:SapC family protein [Thiorhodococcus minor]|uniref:SapC family protein n=1 Tax=Thiorhodococcus minor TaxID=57489 RepID=A0A6M0JU56_9GAMM|nr:SapC family protein [Thiorhodococcus minor]NEV61100.1 SapC family protein [Thiorhodococcus minor]